MRVEDTYIAIRKVTLKNFLAINSNEFMFVVSIL